MWTRCNVMGFSSLYISSSQYKPLYSAVETSFFEILRCSIACTTTMPSVASRDLHWKNNRESQRLYINSCLTHSMLTRFLRSFVQDCRPLINYRLIPYFVIMNCCSAAEPEPTCSPFFEGKDCTKGIPSHFVLFFSFLQ